MIGVLVQLALAGLCIGTIVVTVRSVGKPRQPVSAREAFFNVVINGLLAVVLVVLAVAKIAGLT